MDSLSAFQRDLLFILVDVNGTNGLRIKHHLENYYDKDIHDGQLYPNIEKLIDQGFIHKSKLNGRTNMYTITDDGESVVKKHNEWKQKRI